MNVGEKRRESERLIERKKKQQMKQKD